MSLASAGSHLTCFTTEGKHIPPELLDKVKELGRRYAHHNLEEAMDIADFGEGTKVLAATTADVV
jgi:hypothetical protein